MNNISRNPNKTDHRTIIAVFANIKFDARVQFF